MAKLYLIPNVLSDGPWQHVLPAGISDTLAGIRFFIVENVRTARRFLKQVNPDTDIDSLTFFELNKYTESSALPGFLKPVAEGSDTAVLSEAGCPGIADPGADIVRLAHRQNVQVVPVVGPSSVVLSLMASGLNGQNFSFNGYLPVRPGDRVRSIRLLEKKVQAENQTQMFIETPYRNNQLIADILKTVN